MAAIDFPNSPANGDTFTASNKTWVYLDGKWTLPSVDGLVTSISSATSGQFLKWNGSAWVNDAIDLSTDTTGNYVATLTAGTGITLANNSGEGASPTVTVDTAVIQARVTNVTDTEIGYLDGVTSAIQTQIDTKAPLASPTFTGTVTIPTPISNTDASTKSYVDSTASTTASNASTALTNHEADTTNIHGIADTSILVTTTGTQTLTNKTITSPSGLVKGDVGLGNVDNTSNATERAATATLTNKTLTSPVINTPTGIVKGDVGLGNVDNTSDANKPVSTAQQTALDLKANLASPTFTGTVTVPTPTNNTDAATKAYTDAIVTAAKIITAAGGDGTNGQALTTNGAGTLDFTTIVGTTEASIISAVGADGAAGSVLKTNGSGDLSFGDVALGTNTSGDYVSSLVAGTGVTLTNNSGEGATPTVAIGQAVATNSNVTFNDLTVSGNLTVSGTTTSINTETVTVDDNIIVLNNNATGAPSVDAGIEIERGSSTNVSLRWNETNDKWEFTNDGSTYTDLPAALNDIGDVTITSATSGQFLKWNGTAWVNDSIPTINTLDDVGDVTITSAESGQVLQWNGTAWVNAVGFAGNKQAILGSQIFG